jgi:hypothetical protein
VEKQINVVQLLKTVAIQIHQTANIILGVISVFAEPHAMIMMIYLLPVVLVLVVVVVLFLPLLPLLPLLSLPPPVHLIDLKNVEMVYVVMHCRHAVGMNVVTHPAVLVLVVGGALPIVVAGFV